VSILIQYVSPHFFFPIFSVSRFQPSFDVTVLMKNRFFLACVCTVPMNYSSMTHLGHHLSE